MTARTSILLLLLPFASLACGGGDDVDCTYDESCGGDPTGSWDVAGACSAPEQTTIEECPQATVTRTSAVSGSWSFQDDLDYEFELDTSDIFSIRAPLSCLQREDQPAITSCEQASTQGVVCTTSVDVCDCRQVTTSTSTATGTWAAVDSTLTLTDDFGTVTATYDFCREDDETLKLVLSSFEDQPQVLVLEQ